MFSADDATIVGTSELRILGSKALKGLSEKKVILTQRGKPLGVIQDYEQFKQQEQMIEEFEDFILGHLAMERMKKGGKMIPLEEIEKKLSTT